VNDVRTVVELERSLEDTEPEQLRPAILSGIRREGRRRRRVRLALTAGGCAAAVVVASMSVTRLAGDAAQVAHDPAPAATPRQPRQMDPLVRRALAEIPGAVQVSDWQVVLPEPAGADLGLPSDVVPPDHVSAGPVDVGARSYVGVTGFPRADFPAWLYDGVADYEQHVTGTPKEHQVGSVDIGVLVDTGDLELACIRPLSQWGGDEDAPCRPAMLSEQGGQLTYAWGMGTDDFLQEGEDLELFHSATYGDGSAKSVWVGGTYGTDVASVDLVTTDGATVAATVAPGTLVPDDTMFWGTVDGELAMAITRDASGKVLEKHVLEPCADPVACEVR
jgi:hypothetical protein